MRFKAWSLVVLAILAPACPQPPQPVDLVSIDISPAPSLLPVGATVDLVATGTYSDFSTQDLTSSVTWSSLFPTIADVSPAGLLTAKLGPNVTKIYATSGLIQGSFILTVSDTGINEIYVQVYQTDVGVGNNGFVFDPTGDLPPDGTVDPTEAPAATASGAWNLKGVQPKGGYTTWIRAVGKEASIFNWTDITSLVTWTVDDPGGTGTTLGAGGRVTTGPGAGTVRFIARLPSGITSRPQGGTPKANGELAIADAVLGGVLINPQDVTTPGDPHFGADPIYVAVGATQPAKVTGTFTGPDAGGYCITWDATLTSNNTNLATVDSSGVVTGVAVGTATVTATKLAFSDTIPVNVGAKEVVYLEITPSTASVTAAGTNAQLTATAHFTDGTTLVVTSNPGTSWFAGSPAVVTVSSTGLVQVSMGMVGDTSEVGATYTSSFVDLATGLLVSKITCSNSGDALQTAPPYRLLGLPANLNAVVTVN
jgi:hypothetical protein